MAGQEWRITVYLRHSPSPQRLGYNFFVRYTTLFFDLDDTLYPAQNGVWAAIRERMNAYMLEKLHLPPEQVYELRRQFYDLYGTTLRGLQVHYHVDADDFLAYVHDLPIGQMVKPDAQLRALLLRLPQRKFIFTNSDAAHAGRVLAALGLSDCFDGIIDLRALDFHCKPEPLAYQRALALSGEKEAQRCIYLDDSPRNLAPARWMGMCTILVGDQVDDHASPTLQPYCYRIPRPHDLLQVLPQLVED